MDTPALHGVVQLLDARRDPTADDLGMLDFLAELGVPTIVVATKVDKVKAADRAARLADLAKHAGMSEDQVVPFSTVTGVGRDELAEALLELVAQPSWREA